MKTSTLLGIGALIVILGFAPPAQAQIPEYSAFNLNEATYVGKTLLQPGQYLIRVLPGFTNRNRVQVTSLDKQTIHTTVLTVPHAMGPNEEMPNTMFVYYPAFEGQPQALRTWYASDPVSGGGHDIVYDETRAAMLARAAKAPVVIYRGEVDATAQTEPDYYVFTPDARIETYVAPAPRPATRTELPRTAGTTPLLALLGLLSVAGALVFRAVNR
ncbi:MAG: hypothetical protein ABR524_10810 [Thermoanaerobaculia bacterium]